MIRLSTMMSCHAAGLIDHVYIVLVLVVQFLTTTSRIIIDDSQHDPGFKLARATSPTFALYFIGCSHLNPLLFSCCWWKNHHVLICKWLLLCWGLGLSSAEKSWSTVSGNLFINALLASVVLLIQVYNRTSDIWWSKILFGIHCCKPITLTSNALFTNACVFHSTEKLLETAV